MSTGPVNTLGNTPIEVAVHMGKLDVIRYLVTVQGVDLNGIVRSYIYTVELGYLAHAPDGSTTATCALDNKTRGLASSIILTHPHL